MSSMITNSSVRKAGNGSGSSLVENYKARLQALDVSRGMLEMHIRTIKHLIKRLSVNQISAVGVRYRPVLFGVSRHVGSFEAGC